MASRALTHEVHQHLARAGPGRCARTGAACRAAASRRDVLADDALSMLRHVRDGVVEVDHLGRDLRLAAEGQQLRGQGGGTRRGARRSARSADSRSSAEPDASVSHHPLITVSRLLKSCATPPASCPIASIFWAWRSCASRCALLGHVADEPGEVADAVADERRDHHFHRETASRRCGRRPTARAAGPR